MPAYNKTKGKQHQVWRVGLGRTFGQWDRQVRLTSWNIAKYEGTKVLVFLIAGHKLTWNVIVWAISDPLLPLSIVNVGATMTSALETLAGTVLQLRLKWLCAITPLRFRKFPTLGRADVAEGGGALDSLVLFVLHTGCAIFRFLKRTNSLLHWKTILWSDLTFSGKRGTICCNVCDSEIADLK